MELQVINKDNGNFTTINMHDFLYVKTVNGQPQITTVDGDYRYPTEHELTEFMVNTNVFTKADRNLTINISKVIKTNPDDRTVVFDNGAEVEISIQQIKTINEIIDKK